MALCAKENADGVSTSCRIIKKKRTNVLVLSYVFWLRFYHKKQNETNGSGEIMTIESDDAREEPT